MLTYPDGKWQRIPLHGSRFHVGDAACNQRFVRHLTIETPRQRANLITPPDEGAIAPRAAGLPGVPADVAVVEAPAWEVLVDWLRGGGRLGRLTMAELARLCCVATPQFAIDIGERAAQVAVEMIWERCGPMRDSGGMINSLRPLEEAARRSPRATDALVAALAAMAVYRRVLRHRG